MKGSSRQGWGEGQKKLGLMPMVGAHLTKELVEQRRGVSLELEDTERRQKWGWSRGGEGPAHLATGNTPGMCVSVQNHPHLNSTSVWAGEKGGRGSEAGEREAHDPRFHCRRPSANLRFGKIILAVLDHSRVSRLPGSIPDLWGVTGWGLA